MRDALAAAEAARSAAEEEAARGAGLRAEHQGLLARHDEVQGELKRATASTRTLHELKEQLEGQLGEREAELGLLRGRLMALEQSHNSRKKSTQEASAQTESDLELQARREAKDAQEQAALAAQELGELQAALEAEREAKAGVEARLEQAGREAEAAEEVLRGLQAQLAAAEALRSELKEAQEALEESKVAHAAEMEAAAAAAAAEAAETEEALEEAISLGRVDRALWAEEVRLMED